MPGPLDKHQMDALLEPSSVMVIGASPDPSRFGGVPIENLRRFGYPGEVVPVNPHHRRIRDLVCYPSVLEAPATDAAIVVLRSDLVVDAVRQAGSKGVRIATVVAAGFAERRDDPRAQQRSRELAAAATATGIRLIGPNTTGVLNLATGYVPRASANLAPGLRAGTTAVITQSGAVNNIIVNELHRLGVGTAYAIATGNQLDIRIDTVLPRIAEDPSVDVVLVFPEDTSSPDALLAGVSALLRAGKEVALLQVGRSEPGRMAARLHTASDASFSDPSVTELRQEGAIVVPDLDHLVRVGVLLVRGQRPAGNRLAVVAMSGGEGCVIADVAAAAGFDLPPLTEDGSSNLAAISRLATPGNPFDPTGEILHDPDLFADALRIIASEPQFDAFVVSIPTLGQVDSKRVELGLLAARQATDRPLVVTVWPHEESSREWINSLSARGIVVGESPTLWLQSLRLVTGQPSGAER